MLDGQLDARLVNVLDQSWIEWECCYIQSQNFPMHALIFFRSAQWNMGWDCI